MASNSLFAPSVRAVQPAFIYSDTQGEVKIYFSLSSYNDTNQVRGARVSIVDPNISAANGLNNMIIKDQYYEGEDILNVENKVITID